MSRKGDAAARGNMSTARLKASKLELPPGVKLRERQLAAQDLQARGTYGALLEDTAVALRQRSRAAMRAQRRHGKRTYSRPAWAAGGRGRAVEGAHRNAIDAAFFGMLAERLERADQAESKGAVNRLGHTLTTAEITEIRTAAIDAVRGEMETAIKRREERDQSQQQP